MNNKNYGYQEWRSAEEMRDDTKKWLSELDFILDEESFMENLLGEYFIELSSEVLYAETTKLVKRLTESKTRSKALKESVLQHSNQLIVLLDDIDQPYEEQEVKAQHRRLLKSTEAFFHDFREMKKNIFAVVVDIMKHDKQKRLLN